MFLYSIRQQNRTKVGQTDFSLPKNALHASGVTKDEWVENLVSIQTIEEVGQFFFVRVTTRFTGFDPILSGSRLIPIDPNCVPDRVLRRAPGGACFDGKTIFPNGTAGGLNQIRGNKPLELRRLEYCFQTVMNTEFVGRPLGKRFDRQSFRPEKVTVGTKVQPMSHESAEVFVPIQNVSNVVFDRSEQEF